METKERFPYGGSRQAVYDFLRHNGFIESKWSDKHWDRADGIHLSLYGAGSMARITKDGSVIVDDKLEEAVNFVAKRTA